MNDLFEKRLQMISLSLLCPLWFLACASPPAARSTKARYVLPTSATAISPCQNDAPARQWAVVIGINDYQDEGIPDLDGAVNDAWAFYHYLASPAGGAIPALRMKMLLNQEATREAVEGALGKFLTKSCPQDQVVIYFAGHGMPEPERPEEAFLLVHNTKLDNMVGSAISMNQLPKFLQWRASKTGSLLMFIDACHSGTINFPGKRGLAMNEPVKRIQQMSKGIASAVTKQQGKGWGAISATASSQFAGEKKGGCLFGDYPYHGGIFTCHLLKGLSGAADKNANSKVSLDELYSYLYDSVRRDSREQQLPQLSGSLKGGLTLSYVGTNTVGIPILPEKYTGVMEHPLRPWIYAGTALTAAATITASVFAVMWAGSEAQLNGEPLIFGDERTLVEQQSQEQSQMAALTGGIAGGLGALTLSALLIDLLQAPEDINDVYEKRPLFELRVSPSDHGVEASLDLNFTW